MLEFQEQAKKHVDGHNPVQRDQSTAAKHQTGIVKIYKTVEQYGFFKVQGWDDVYFNMKDFRASHINIPPKVGETYNFDIQKKHWDDKTVKLRAARIIKAQFDEMWPKNSVSSNWTEYRNSHVRTGSVQPHFKKDVASGNSGTIVAEGSRNRNDPSKSSGHIRSVYKVGNPVSVAIGKPVAVSATGPNSAEMAPNPIEESTRKLQGEISRKKCLFKSLNLAKLPDGGRRLQEEIENLESKLKNIHLNGDKKAGAIKSLTMCQPQNICPEQESEKDFDTSVNSRIHSSYIPYQSVGNDRQESYVTSCATTKNSSLQIHPVPEKQFGAKFVDFPHLPDGPLFGGRMTNDRLSEVRLVTKAAIEDMHNSLKNCPDTTTEEIDPKGLKVDLMTHQKQALAWLLWREKQTVSGGILADDMGLGKTLTMISLILKQRENEGTDIQKADHKIDDFETLTDSIHVSEDEAVDTPNKDSDKEDDELEKSESTLIVAPASLVFHWEKEIRNRCHILSHMLHYDMIYHVLIYFHLNTITLHPIRSLRCDKGLLSIHLYHGTGREKDPSRLSEFDVVITTYDIVRRCSLHTSDKRESTLLHIDWRRVILDEAHKIKNVKSQSSEAVCKIAAKSRWAMTGTPVQNDITDMYAILKFLNYRPFSEYKLWKNQVDNKTSQGRQRLKTLTSCVLLRREKASLTKDGAPIVSLPPRKTFDHIISLTKIEEEVYEKLKQQSKATYNEYEDSIKGKGRQPCHNKEESGQRKPVTATALLVLLLRMRQCCGHLSLLKGSFDLELLENEKKELALEHMFQSMAIDDISEPKLDLEVGTDKSQYFEANSSSAKVDFVIKELNRMRIESPCDKSVIISQWTSMLDVVACHLKKCGFSFERITGAQTAKKRMDTVDQFNRNPVNPMVILLSLQAGGVGLNLIGGNHLYVLDMHWNPALESQACDRIYRVGQKKPVFIHRFIVKNTVEENIRKLQAHKLSLAKAVMDGANPKESQKLSLRDMKLLFGL